MSLRSHSVLIYGLFVWTFSVAFTYIGFGQEADPISFDSVHEFVNSAVENGTVAGGSIIVFHEGKIVWQTGFGFFDIKSKTPFEVDIPAVIASISKPLFGTTIFRLADANKLSLDDSVAKFLPEFEGRQLEKGESLKRPPMISELLTHTSGLRGDNAKGGRIWYESWTENKTLESVIKKVAKDLPFASQPNSKFAYSGIGTDVVARVGEVSSGLTRNEMIQTLLCSPLGMTSTFYRDAAGLDWIAIA